jgi:NADH-quinone oxidoreductase subunit J
LARSTVATTPSSECVLIACFGTALRAGGASPLYPALGRRANCLLSTQRSSAPPNLLRAYSAADTAGQGLRAGKAPGGSVEGTESPPQDVMDSLFLPLLLGCAVSLLSALGVVLARRPVYSAVFLLVHSLSLAALFGILSAAMVAVGQVIIYSGAIVVLFLFVVTLLPTGGRELNATASRVAAACVAGGGLLVALAAAFASGAIPAATSTGDLASGSLSVAAVGHSLFGPLLVAFELTAPLLLVAVVGAVVIWRRHEPRSRTAPSPAITAEPRRVVLHR